MIEKDGNLTCEAIRLHDNKSMSMEIDMKDNLRSWMLIVLLGCVCLLGGCAESKEIIDLTAPSDQPQLQQLESHLDYVDPDAGQPNYRRDD